jgi:hypothetical protein
MAATRLRVRRLRDILRLKYEAGLGHRAIAWACSIGGQRGLGALEAGGGCGPAVALPADLDDAALEARLFASPGVVPGGQRQLPHWRAVHLELKRPRRHAPVCSGWSLATRIRPGMATASFVTATAAGRGRSNRRCARLILISPGKSSSSISRGRPGLVDGATGEVVVVGTFRRRPRREPVALCRGQRRRRSCTRGSVASADDRRLRAVPTFGCATI